MCRLTTLVSVLLLFSLISNRDSLMWNWIVVLGVSVGCVVAGVVVAGLAGNPWASELELWRKLKSLMARPGVFALAFGGPVPVRLLLMGCHLFAALLAFSLGWSVSAWVGSAEWG